MFCSCGGILDSNCKCDKCSKVYTELVKGIYTDDKFLYKAYRVDYRGNFKLMTIRKCS